MPAAKPAVAKPPNSYELLATRIQKTINSTSAQKAKTAMIFKATDEAEEDWAQLLGEIAEIDNVTLAHRDDGGVHIFWVVPQED